MNSLTTDTFFNGRIKVKQHQNGYRFSIDAVLLAFHVQPRPGETVLDLGTGCGIIPLILAHRYPESKIYGIEIQEELAEIAQTNVRENHMQDRITIWCLDMRHRTPLFPEPVDIVVSNPPYRKAASGRINPNLQRAVARHELESTLEDVLLAAAGMLQTAGRFNIIYPAQRLTELLGCMCQKSIEPKTFRTVHSNRQSEAKMVLVGGTRNGRPGLRIEPPLVIYNSEGAYTDEVAGMFEADRLYFI